VGEIKGWLEIDCCSVDESYCHSFILACWAETWG